MDSDAALGLCLKRGKNGVMSPVSRGTREARDADSEHCSTIEAARLLGMAVRSVQLMVDRGELQAWKTPGGHRRIARASVERALLQRGGSPAPLLRGALEPKRGRGGAAADNPGSEARPPAVPGRAGSLKVLLIEDSRHFQNLIGLLVQQHFPQVEWHLADDGVSGLAMAGSLQPEVLLVDILLPGIDGATLISGLRSHAAFGHPALVVVTSLQGEELAAYAHALEGIPVVHKSRLVTDLPPLLAAALAARATAPTASVPP